MKHRKVILRNSQILICLFYCSICKSTVDKSCLLCIETRMTTFIKKKFKISEDQTNINKYRLAANITVYHIISKLILQRIIITNYCGLVNHLRWSTISDLESPLNLQIKGKKLFKSVHKQGNWTFVVREWFEGKYNSGFGISIKFPSQRKNYWKRSRNNEIMLI